MGKANENLVGIDIVSMREGPQLSADQKRVFGVSVTEIETVQALKDIADLKAPGVDGLGAKFNKASWSIANHDVIAAVMEFFTHNLTYQAVNSTLVSLIPKDNAGTTIKDFRPISCCTIIYKLISKVLTGRMSKVMTSIINQSQAAFVLG